MTQASDPWFDEVVNPIEALLERWQTRGDVDVAKALLPEWRGNFGLTDGWANVLVALRSLEQHGGLPEDEVATLTQVANRIERAINRS